MRILDESEISARLNFDIGRLVSEPFSAFVQHTLTNNENDVVIPSTIMLQAVKSSDEIAQPIWGQVVLQIRAGSKIGEKVYFCNAEFSTDWVLAWLEDLDKELGARLGDVPQG